MTKLYVANTTKQYHQFSYRLEQGGTLRHEFINPGAQILVMNQDLSPEQLSFVVGQHTKYGMCKYEEVPRGKQFIGLVYREGKPVDVEMMLVTFEQNVDALNTAGEERLQRDVAAIRKQVEERIEVPLKRIEVEKRETGTVQHPESGGGTVDVAVEIPAEGVAPRHREGRPARAGGRTAF